MKSLALAIGVLIFLNSCSSVLYHPTPHLFIDPKRVGLIYENIEFISSDGIRLKGWFFPAQRVSPPLREAGLDDRSESVRMQEARATIIHFHGNGENRSSHFATLIWAVERGYNLFTFDYRGYADSEGRPSPSGVYRDGMAAIRWVKDHAPRGTDKRDLIFYGQSLGGAVLARCFEDVVNRDRAKSVVIESSFHSYHAIARNVLSRSWLTWPFQWLGITWVSDETSPEDSFADISPVPLLVMHGTHDRLVPLKFGEEIYERAREPKSFWKIPRGRHLNLFAVEQGRYQDEIVKYWESLP